MIDRVPLFLARIEHPDEDRWQRWIGPHVEWLEERVADGSLVASGPAVGLPHRGGILVIDAADEEGAWALLRTDPFWTEGVVEHPSVVGWDPVFGRLRDRSSHPDGITAEQMRG